MKSDKLPGDVERLLETPDLGHALETEQFKQFLDRMPVAVAVSQLSPLERIIYANNEFAALTGQPNSDILGQEWDSLPGTETAPEKRALGDVLAAERDYVGSFVIVRAGGAFTLDAWSNVVDDDAGNPAFRLVALVEAAPRNPSIVDELEDRVREKDTQLRELQHRVKNNLQMITALIRAEARGVTDRSTSEGFDRLAGRVESLGLLYRALSDSAVEDTVDLGIYLSEIASAVMRAHAAEGIHLDLQVDTWMVSIDVAMPTGLVVNELLTNSLKHAFVERSGGTITLHCSNQSSTCEVIVADDGVGMPSGSAWPKPGKLSALIVRSLLQNAKAEIKVRSSPGAGTSVAMTFLKQIGDH